MHALTQKDENAVTLSQRFGTIKARAGGWVTMNLLYLQRMQLYAFSVILIYAMPFDDPVCSRLSKNCIRPFSLEIGTNLPWARVSG